MSPQVEEQAQAVGQQVRDFARLHVDLARTEIRDGSARFLWGLVLVGASVCVGTVAIVAFVVALFLLLRTVLSPVLAATCVAVILGLLSAIGFRWGWSLIRRIRSVSLPRTRAMVGEIFQWREDKNNS